MPSPFHRGDYKRVRRSVTIAMLELESLEVRAQVAYKQGLIPADAAADLSLARLMVTELDKLLRQSLDVAISDHYEVYADATFTDHRLADAG